MRVRHTFANREGRKSQPKAELWFPGQASDKGQSGHGLQLHKQG